MKMRHAAALLALFGAATPAMTQTASTRGIIGNWLVDDGTAVIAVTACGNNKVCGRISRFIAREPAGGFRDTNNPDRALRSRSLIGAAVLTDLTREGNSWTGRGYSPQEGRNFNATVTLPSATRLNIRGCVAIFCRTVVWSRAQ